MSYYTLLILSAIYLTEMLGYVILADPSRAESEK